MIVSFTGWRGWDDAKFIQRTIEDLFGRHAIEGRRDVPLQARVGDADGADAIVRTFLAGMDATLMTVYFADWTSQGKAAGAIRNKRMLLGDDPFDPSKGKPADLLIAFPQPGRLFSTKGSGTWNCIGQAHYRGVEVRIPAYTSAHEVSAADEPLLLLAGYGQPGGER